MTTVGATYQTQDGYIGVAAAQTVDPAGIVLPSGALMPLPLTQLQLTPESIAAGGIDMRWYPDADLTEQGGGG